MSEPTKAAPAAPAVTPKPVTTSVFQRTTPVAAPSIAAGVSAASPAGMPKGMVKVNTNDLPSKYFHGILYSETDARKTTTAALFGPPEKVRIVQTRRAEQLIPLLGMGYEAVIADSSDKFEYAMRYPEKIWPEWAGQEERVLVVDDITEAKDILLDENSTNEQGRELRDNRKIHVGAKKDMREIMKVAIQKPQHLVCVALARVTSNELTGEEIIGPDLPPAMMNMLNTDFEYVFYIKKGGALASKILTQEDRQNFQKKDEKTNEMKMLSRRIFAKIKLPKDAKDAVKKEEEMDLYAIWQKIKAIRGGKQ